MISLSVLSISILLAAAPVRLSDVQLSRVGERLLARGTLQVSAEPTVRLRIDSDDPKIELFEFSPIGVIGFGGGASYVRSVCRAPCDTEVSTDYRSVFRVGGPDAPMSERIDLSGLQGNVTVKVKAGSSAKRGWGAALTALGTTGLICGGVTWGIGALVSQGGSGSMEGLATTGAIVTFASLIPLVAGILLSATSGTSYAVLPGAPAASSGEGSSAEGALQL